MQPTPDAFSTHAGAPPVRMAVDLSHLRPGGESGGIKPFLFETLRWLGKQERVPLQFLYLTCASTHGEVCAELARSRDEVICVRDNGGALPRGDERAPRERLFLPPPLDLLVRLEAHVLYCPLGSAEFVLPGISTVSTIVDVLHRDFPWSLDPHHIAERERIFQQTLAASDALQCNSEHVVARLREHYGPALPQTFTVYNVIHERFAGPAPQPVASPGTPTDGGVCQRREPPFFFYPANAWKHKNHETLLLAYGLYRAAALTAGKPLWRLVLTGHEDERWAELRSLARTLDLLGEDAVRFLGYVPTAELGRLWTTAGALVFPSLHEGFGIPLLEAMRHDVPVLCSREGSLPEVGGEACLGVNARCPEALAEGMWQLATDEPLRTRLVTAGRQRLMDFSQEREAGRLLEVITSLAKTPPPYRPFSKGIFPDGWTEPLALLALPSPSPMLGCLTLRFHPMPQARRLRLRAGRFVALGSFELPPDRPDAEVSVEWQVDGSPLWLEIPNAANLNPNDERIHGVRLHTAALRTADGREYPLFTT